MNTPLLLVNDLEVKMNTPVWRGLAQTGVFISIKICVISHERTAMVELSSKIDAATAQKQGGWKGLFGSSSRDSGNDESVNTAEKRSIAEHLKRSFCVVVKPNWNDYVFVPESVENETVNGQVYLKGKHQGTASYPADTEEFILYRGKYLDDVLEQELIRRQDRNTHE